MNVKPASDLAAAASEAIRALNQATGPGNAAAALREPPDVYDTIGWLKELADRLPQAFSQISRRLASEYEAGRVAHVSGRDAGPWVAGVTGALDDAARGASMVAGMLGKAQVPAAGLSAEH
jgi:hypothetical protein